MTAVELAEDVRTIGDVTAICHNADGSLAYERHIHNVTTNYQRKGLAKWLSGINNTGYNPVAPPNYIALGDGSPTPPTTGPEAGDESLWNEIVRNQCSARTAYQDYYAQYTAVFTATDPTGTFTEAGLLDASSSGNLWAHVALRDVTKATGQTLTVVWRILVQGS